MKKILFILIVCLFSTLGCENQASSVSGPTKTYDLQGREVSFVSPAEPWKAHVQTVGEDNATMGLPADRVVGITFRRPEKDGLIAVGALDQQKNDKDQFIELENDQETLNQIANWVIKRDGEILENEYIKVLGVNAYHMTFKVGKDAREKKGEQIHFTKDGKHYTMSILVPAADYDKEVGQFRNLVKDFNIKKKS